MQNPKDNSDPITAMNKALALVAKAFKINTIPINNNQRSSVIPRNSQIAQPGINTSQDINMKMVDDNVGNQVRHNAVQNDRNEYGNGNVVTSPAEGNGNGINETEIVKVSCTLEDTLQQASISRTQSDKAPVYDSDGLAESWKVYSVICSKNDSNGENQVVSKSSSITTTDASDKRQQQDSALDSSNLATTITVDGNFDL
nr:hypothetical protein [Tanacetum cinerariifolium]GEX17682.1 hypothetical protein [Tanacetum cinerariifolium]